MTSTVISSSDFNLITADIATGLSTAICKDGQTACTARIPFAFGINVTDATNATSTGTGAIFTAGGVGIAKALWVGGLANIAGAATITGAITNSTLTSGRVVTAGASGILQDSANLTWTSPELSIGAAGVTGALKMLGSTSGTTTVTAPAAAGTPTLTWPTTSGALMGYADSRWEFVQTSRDLTAATGNQNITGAGFNPTGCILLGAVTEGNRMSLGFAESTGAEQWSVLAPDGSNTTGEYTVTTNAIGFQTDGSNKQLGTVSFISDGIQIAWVKTGTPTGTGDFGVLFLR